MIVQHATSLNNKALVQKSFGNLIKIMKDERLKKFIENPKEHIAMCMRRTLNFEGRHS